MFTYDKVKMAEMRKKMIAMHEKLKKANIRAEKLIQDTEDFCNEIRAERIERLKKQVKSNPK